MNKINFNEFENENNDALEMSGKARSVCEKREEKTSAKIKFFFTCKRLCATLEEDHLCNLHKRFGLWIFSCFCVIPKFLLFFIFFFPPLKCRHMHEKL